MTSETALEKLSEGVRAAAEAEPLNYEAAIERFLERELERFPAAERLALVEQLALRFSGEGSMVSAGPGVDTDAMAELLSLLLGKNVSRDEISGDELSKNFARALNTVFDTVNQIVAGINANLFGQKAELETIRHVIGSQIEKSGPETSLQSYLQQIQQSFLLAHSSFQEASLALVREILSALDPETCEATVRSSMKFGPLRKAELYEIYQQKCRECRKWVDSGHYTEKLLREFEKICQKKCKT